MKKFLFCPNCGNRHVDQNKEIHPVHNGITDYFRKVNFALKPHRFHTCSYCGKTFEDSEKKHRYLIHIYSTTLKFSCLRVV